MVGKHPYAGEIQLSIQLPNDLRRDVPEAAPGRIIGEYDAEENSPLTAPILADFVANPPNFRPEGPLDSSNGCVDLGLLRNS
jgi:hypothetical protein